MKPQTLVGLGVLAATAAGTPALAQSAKVDISGSAEAVCSIGGTFASITVGDMLNKSNGGLNAATINGKSTSIAGSALCNGLNSTLAVTAVSLTASAPLPAGAGDAGFTNTVHFTATASLPGGYASGVTSVADKSGVSGGTTSKVGLLVASAGQFVVTLSDAALPGTSKFLMADKSYSGSVTLTLAGVV